MAATAHAGERLIRRSDRAREEWTVDAITDDRFVHMDLGLRSDRSVSEETTSIPVSEILAVSYDDVDADGEPGACHLTFEGSDGPHSIEIAEPIGRALNRHRDGGAS